MKAPRTRRFIWLMTVTVSFVALIVLNSFKPIDQALLGVLGGIVFRAGEHYFDQHTKPEPTENLPDA